MKKREIDDAMVERMLPAIWTGLADLPLDSAVRETLRKTARKGLEAALNPAPRDRRYTDKPQTERRGGKACEHEWRCVDARAVNGAEERAYACERCRAIRTDRSLGPGSSEWLTIINSAEPTKPPPEIPVSEGMIQAGFMAFWAKESAQFTRDDQISSIYRAMETRRRLERRRSDDPK